MKLAAMKDVFNEDNLLSVIECTDAITGEHIFDVEWMPQEEHTIQNIMDFRKFAISMLKNKDYRVK